MCATNKLRHVKRYLALLVIKEKQIRTAARYYFMSAGMPVVEDRQQLVEVNTGKPEAYCFAGENLKWCSHFGMQFGGVLVRVLVAVERPWPKAASGGKVCFCLQTLQSHSVTE